MRIIDGVSRLSVAVGLIALAGCYTELPLGMTVPKPEARVIARLTDVGADRMASAIGVAADEVEGVVQAADDSTWRLNLLRVDQRGGVSTIWKREPVTFPRWALTEAKEKRLNKKASWLAAGAATVGALLLQRLLSGGFSGDEGKETTPPPPS